MGPAGPGAIVDLGDESFVVMTIDTWRTGKMTSCDLHRLSSKIGVANLNQPMSGDRKKPNSSIGLLRFPRWMFCPSCRYMVRWTEEDEKVIDADHESGTGKPVCRRQSCQGSIQLVPMRFVQICEMGHLDDVDWLYWVHRGGHQCQNPAFLKFVSLAGKGSGLGSLEVCCKQCGARRGLDDLTRTRHKCRSETAWTGGRQPWQRDRNASPCSHHVTVVQRGDSNVHFSSVISALDIPDPDQLGEGDDPYHHVRRNTEFNNAKILWGLLRDNGIPVDTIRDKVDKRFSGLHERLGIANEKLHELLDGVEPSDEDGVTIESDPAAALKAEEFDVLAEPERWNTPVFSGESYSPLESDYGVELSRILERVSLNRQIAGSQSNAWVSSEETVP